MNTKRIMVIAIFVIALAGIVSANVVSSSDPQEQPQSFYESKYVPTSPGYNFAQQGAPGSVIFYMRGVTVQDSTVYVKNNLQNVSAFDPKYNPDGSVIPDQNTGYLKIKMQAEGDSDIIPFAAGNYTAYLQHGNGDQMEVQKFSVGAGETTRVVFLGAAIPSGGHVFVFKIISAQYGATETCERVLVTPAHNEYRVRGHWHTEQHWHDGHWYIVYEWDHSSQWTSWSDEQYPRWNDIPHNDKQTRNVAAVYETTCTGGFADVTAYFQQNLHNGVIKPIITGDTNDWSWLLSFQSFYGSFPDPAVGIEKGLIVKYTVDNGAEQTIEIPNVNSAAPEVTLTP